MPEPAPVRKKIFISYSHDDQAWFEDLKGRLVPLQRRHGFEIWDDSQLRAGQDWHAEIQKALGETKLALLLVSPNFMKSDYIDKHEVRTLLEAQARSEGLIIAPLHLRHVDIDDYPELKRPQALNNPAQPLERLKEKLADLDEEFVKISLKIKQLMQAPASPGAEDRPTTLRASAVGAGNARTEADEDEEDIDQDDGGEALPVDEMIAEALQTMFDEPGQQAVALSADDGEETTLLMLLTEGAEDNLICEIASNDEMHPDLRLDRKAIRLLIDEFGFEEPEYRGDRLWKDLGPIDELDVAALAVDLADLLDAGFGVPNEDLDIVSNIYAV